MRLRAICCAWYSYPLPRCEPGHALVPMAWTALLKQDQASGRPEWLSKPSGFPHEVVGKLPRRRRSFTRASRSMDLL